jgi:hypothetical protein
MRLAKPFWEYSNRTFLLRIRLENVSSTPYQLIFHFFLEICVRNMCGNSPRICVNCFVVKSSHLNFAFDCQWHRTGSKTVTGPLLTWLIVTVIKCEPCKNLATLSPVLKRYGLFLPIGRDMYSFLRFLDLGWHGEEFGRHEPADLPIIFRC